MKPDRMERGARAEQLVSNLLEDRGFQILGRNVHLGHLEVDIVARDGDLAVMVEVRARGRGAFERPLQSLTSGKKRMHLLNAADRLWRLYLARVPGIRRFRIDAAAVDLREEPPIVHYVEGALTR